MKISRQGSVRLVVLPSFVENKGGEKGADCLLHFFVHLSQRFGRTFMCFSFECLMKIVSITGILNSSISVHYSEDKNGGQQRFLSFLFRQHTW